MEWTGCLRITKMIENFFSPFLYRGMVSEHNNMKKELLPYFEEKYNDNPDNQPSDWLCKVHTSYEKFDQNLATYTKNYRENLDEFLTEIGFPISNIEIVGPWFNMYKKDQWQEIHHHSSMGYYFSAVHFLKYDPEIHSPLVFANLNRMLVAPYWLGRQCKSSFYDEKLPFNAKEGEIVIFPSLIEHEVPVQKTDDPRVTISFNIKITPVN